jgi:hypothetical protein
MAWVPCPHCNGCGETVKIFITHDSNGKEITHQQAVPCTGCIGRGGWEE